MARRSSTDPLMYSAEVDWFLTMRDAECGYRSSLAGQIRTIERGFGVPTSDRYNEAQCELGPSAHSAFARDRRMTRRWRLLSRHTQAVFIAYYLASCPEECEPYRDVETGDECHSRRRFPLGVEPAFGQLAGVVLYLADPTTRQQLTKAAKASAEKKFENRHDGKAEAAIKRATAEVRSAHQEYLELCMAETERSEPEPILSWVPPDLNEELRELGSAPQSARRYPDGVWRQEDAA